MGTKKLKKIILESGLRDINALSNRYKKAKIYFHQDLDGVLHVGGTTLSRQEVPIENIKRLSPSRVIHKGSA